MIFEERQKNGKFYYQVEDVFGTMKFSSKTKLDAERLDQIFMAVFSIKSSAKTIVGEIEELGLKYKFIKKNQWSEDDIDKKFTADNSFENTPEYKQTLYYKMFEVKVALIKFFIELCKVFGIYKLINKLNSIIKKYDKQ